MPPKPSPIPVLTLSHRPLSISTLPPHLRHASSSTHTAPKTQTSASATSQISPQQDSHPLQQQTSPKQQISPQPQHTPPQTSQASQVQASSQTPPPKHKTQAELDLELREKLEVISGEGGAAGLELEGGVPVAMKRGVRSNMFRVI